MSEQSHAAFIREPESKRLAYADPPYPGKAHLYPENTEVDHVELIARLSEYDGWALSTDETSLRYVIGLCPANVRVCAWCRTNDPPFTPNPVRSWEPVLLKPARIGRVTARTFLIDNAPSGFLQRGLTGSKTAAFCDWVLRCIGADTDDTLDDLYPGTGIMGEVFASFRSQLTLPSSGGKQSKNGRENVLRRTHDPIPGIEAAPVRDERTTQRRAKA